MLFKGNNLESKNRNMQHSWDSNLGLSDSCLLIYTRLSGIIWIVGDGYKHIVFLKFTECSINICGCLFCVGGSVPGDGKQR